jgi:hypothetical protein
VVRTKSRRLRGSDMEAPEDDAFLPSTSWW